MMQGLRHSVLGPLTRWLPLSASANQTALLSVMPQSGRLRVVTVRLRINALAMAIAPSSLISGCQPRQSFATPHASDLSAEAMHLAPSAPIAFVCRLIERSDGVSCSTSATVAAPACLIWFPYRVIFVVPSLSLLVAAIALISVCTPARIK